MIPLLPLWRSIWGFLTFAFVGVAYMLKVSARNRPASPALRGRAYSVQGKPQFAGIAQNYSPGSFKAALILALPLFAISHSPQEQVDAWVAKIDRER